jgi:polyvinyl alcohol dehydrogenase (cytochrome)
MVPDNHGVPGGYSGGAVWGTTPALDPATNTLYVTTGNNYTVPQSAKDCQDEGGTAGECLSPDDHIDAIVALNASTGQIKWATGVKGFDDWNVGCIIGPPPNNCPEKPGAGLRLRLGPEPVHDRERQERGRRGRRRAEERPVLGARRDHRQDHLGRRTRSGLVARRDRVGPRDRRQADLRRRGELQRHSVRDPRRGTTTSGSWAALDPATGNVLWQVADPSHNAFGGGNALGPVSVENGVLYVPSMSGTMRALDAANGKTLWSFQAAGSVNTGAVVVDGVVYWGSGYAHLGIPGWTGSTTFYAFSINGN